MAGIFFLGLFERQRKGKAGTCPGVLSTTDQECKSQMLQQIGAHAVTGVDVGGKVGHAPEPGENLKYVHLGLYISCI